MSNEWSGIIGVFIGALLGWLFNYLGHRTTVADVNRRITNKVIYSLLSIRFELLKLSEERNAEMAIRAMEKATGESVPEEFRDAVKRQMGETGTDLLEDSVFENLEELSERFKDIILSFAEIDPEGAYRLSDASKFLINLDYFEDYMEGVKKQFGSTITSETYDAFENCFKRNNLQNSIETMKNEIVGLAKRSSKQVRLDVEGVLHRQDRIEPNIDDFNECMNILLEQN